MRMQSYITVKDLLKKHKLYTKEIREISYHLNIMWCDANDLVYSVLGLSNLEEKELVIIIYNLILKCNMESPNYDRETDEQLIRIGNSMNTPFLGKISERDIDNIYDDNYGLDKRR